MYKMGEKKMEVTEKMTEFQLEKAATLKTIAIRAKKVGEMVDFYKKVMGFVLKSEENNLSIWGTREAGTQLLILEETRKAEDFHNEEKQMAYFSIKVPTEKEFLQIALLFFTFNETKTSPRKNTFFHHILNFPLCFFVHFFTYYF